MVFLVAHGGYMEEICRFPLMDSKLEIKSGLLQASKDDISKNLYSLFQITVKRQEIYTFVEMYTTLEKFNIVPRVIGAKENNYIKNHCDIFFANVVSIDFETYPYIRPIKEAYATLIDVLIKIGVVNQFYLNKNSFVYDLLTDKFLFIDILNLATTESLKEICLLEKHANDVFVKWIFENKFLILRSDNIQNDFDRRKKFYFEEYQEKYGSDLNEVVYSLKENLDLTKNHTQFSNLEIKCVTEKEHYLLTASLKDQIKTFKLEKESTFSVYVCQKQDEIIECMKVHKNTQDSLLNWNFNVRSDQRIDVEVQHPEHSFKITKINLYKINIILTPEDAPGVVPDKNEFLFKLKTGMESNDLYCICETNHQDLRVVDSRFLYFEFNTVSMKTKPLENKTGKNIYQVSESIFSSLSNSCRGTNKKIFVMEKDKDINKILFIDRTEDENSLISFKFVNKPDRVFQNYITKCNKTTQFSNLFFKLNLDLKSKESRDTNNDKSRFISFEKTLILESTTEYDLISEVCLESFKNETSYQVNYELEDYYSRIKEKNDFVLNFNSASDKRVRNMNSSHNNLNNLVILSIKDENETIDPKFNNFEIAELEPFRIYVSIKLTSDKKYEVRAIFFDDQNTLKEIEISSKKNTTFEKLPTKIFTEIKDGTYFWKTNPTPIELQETDSHYLSKSEIVYSIKIDNFKDCYPNLGKKQIEKNENQIYIKCSFWDKITPTVKAGKIVNDPTPLPVGLQKLYNQLKKK